MKCESTYIMNLEACYIYKDIAEGKKITYRNRDLVKLFSATIPYSIETIRINEFFPDSFYTVNNKQYTRKIINVTFDKNYTKWNEEAGRRELVQSKKDIRKYLYENGFVMDGVKYVFYKRGAGKAKNGYALYIQESMRDTLISASRLGHEFEKDEELDYTSLLAYESLIMSGLEFTITLDPKTEILLIDDIYGLEFDSYASVTEFVNNKLDTKNKEIKLKNCLTDGQGLLDESVFGAYGKSDKGFMLLRNDMFKCCAFNTKLSKWFEFNGVKKVKDMFGNEYDAEKIKLVTTPNSLKFLKFSYKVDGGSKSDGYNHWKEKAGNLFGVVKCDKSGNYGNYNRTTYQILNSIPGLTYDDLMDITKLERDYVNLLENEPSVFKNHIGCNAESVYKINNAIDEDYAGVHTSTDLLSTLLLVNPDVQYTDNFKRLKKDLISNYVDNLRIGKVRMENVKYVTIVSNPFEMLLASIGEYKGESIMRGREVYCKYYMDGESFCATRNPHINAGNIMFTKNKYRQEYDDWFNFTDNICAINFFDNDAPDRLQGCDTDSDTILLNPHEILCERAIYCESTFPTPINRVEGVGKLRKCNMDELSDLDSMLSDNYIGKIVNLSQIINSYMNDAISKNESEVVINRLYQYSSRLSSLSQIEIDKSKKVFDNVNMRKELKRIRDIKYIRYVEEDDQFGNRARKMVVPMFFSMVSKDNSYRVFEHFNTPMDILQEIFNNDKNERKRSKKVVKMIDLLVKTKEISGHKSMDSVSAIFDIVESCGKRINGLRLPTCTLNSDGKSTVERRLKKDAVEKLNNLSPSTPVILFILRRCFELKRTGEFNFKKYATLTLNLLFLSKKSQVLMCFKSENYKKDVLLIEDISSYDFDIFGKKYRKIVLDNHDFSTQKFFNTPQAHVSQGLQKSR